MIRRGIVLPSRRFFAWTTVSILVPMTLAFIAWALKADVLSHPIGVGVSVLVGASSFVLVMGALELLKRVELAGWSFEAPLLRNWVGYYGLWALVGLGIGCARAAVLQAAFEVTFQQGRLLAEVAICLYAMVLVAFSLEHQTMFLREAARKQEESRRAVRFLFESREAFLKARDLRCHEVLALLEQRVEPELRAVHEGVARLREGGEADEAYEGLLARLDRLRDMEIRKLSHLLHPSIIDVGLSPALRALARRRGSLAIDIEGDSALLEELSGGLRLQVYRVIEQALDLASVQGARRLRVGLAGDRAQGLTLDIEAWGEGIDLSRVRRSPGFALLDARVALLNGRWEVLVASDVRIRVCVLCPLSEPEAQVAIPRR